MNLSTLLASGRIKVCYDPQMIIDQIFTLNMRIMLKSISVGKLPE